MHRQLFRISSACTRSTSRVGVVAARPSQLFAASSSAGSILAARNFASNAANPTADETTAPELRKEYSEYIMNLAEESRQFFVSNDAKKASKILGDLRYNMDLITQKRFVEIRCDEILQMYTVGTADIPLSWYYNDWDIFSNRNRFLYAMADITNGGKDITIDKSFSNEETEVLKSYQIFYGTQCISILRGGKKVLKINLEGASDKSEYKSAYSRRRVYVTIVHSEQEVELCHGTFSLDKLVMLLLGSPNGQVERHYGMRPVKEWTWYQCKEALSAFFRLLCLKLNVDDYLQWSDDFLGWGVFCGKGNYLDQNVKDDYPDPKIVQEVYQEKNWKNPTFFEGAGKELIVDVSTLKPFPGGSTSENEQQQE